MKVPAQRPTENNTSNVTLVSKNEVWWKPNHGHPMRTRREEALTTFGGARRSKLFRFRQASPLSSAVGAPAPAPDLRLS